MPRFFVTLCNLCTIFSGLFILIPHASSEGSGVNSCEKFLSCPESQFSCSNQINGAEENDCIVVKFNNVTSYEDCQRQVIAKFPDLLNQDSPNKEFVVMPTVFRRKINKCSDSFTVFGTGLNVTTQIGRGTKGILFYINVETPANPKFCRAIRLKNLPSSLQYPLHLWYDCMFFFDNESGQAFQVHVTNYPFMDNKQSFRGLVVQHLTETIKNWMPPILIEVTSMQSGRVNVWFQEAPPSLGIFNYYVKIKLDGKTVKQEFVVGLNRNSNDNRAILRKVMFKDLEGGKNYIAMVSADDKFCGELKCQESSSPPFIFFSENKRINVLSPTTIILVSCATVMFTLILVITYCCRNMQTEQPNVVLLYSFDDPVHNAVVSAFNQALRKCGVRVYIDKDAPAEDPDKWLEDHVLNNNFTIIFVMSSGAMFKLGRSRPVTFIGEPGYLTSHMLTTAMEYLKRKIYRGNFKPSSLMGVIWDNAKEREARKILSRASYFYTLPKAWPKLLCHLYHGRKGFWPCFQSHKGFGKSLQSFPEGENLLKALQHLKKKGNNFRLDDNQLQDHEHYNNNATSNEEEDIGYYSLTQPSIDVQNRQDQLIDEPSAEFLTVRIPPAGIDTEPYYSAADSRYDFDQEKIEEMERILEYKPNSFNPVEHHNENDGIFYNSNQPFVSTPNLRLQRDDAQQCMNPLSAREPLKNEDLEVLPQNSTENEMYDSADAAAKDYDKLKEMEKILDCAQKSCQPPITTVSTTPSRTHVPNFISFNL